MKNIEQIIRESLENHEMPYNEAAWESMSKRLDGSTPSPFYRKWWVAASVGTMLVGSALFFALNSQSESAQKPKNNTPVISQNKATDQKNDDLKKSVNSSENKITPQTSTLQSDEVSSVRGSVITSEHVINHHIVADQNLKSDPNPKSATPQNTPISIKGLPENGPEQKIAYLPATTNKTKYCIGDEIEIGNPNESGSVLVVQNNRTILTVKPGAKKILVASNEGNIDLVIGNQKQTVLVSKPISDLYISVDPTLLYEDGIPAIRFSVSGNNAPVHWISENHASELDNGTFIVHPYKGKEISVSAFSKDQNGCPVVETKTITISEDYNLNAPKGIDLNSSDPRVSTFMPHALKERNTPFELYVYDAKSGRVIYKTTDVSAGWNGTDTNTGEVLKNGTVVLWKVILAAPNSGEPREYKGTILVKTQ